jgi:hypothetical protein
VKSFRALLVGLTMATALAVGIASPARAARPPSFTCSYSGNTTIQWSSDKLNKLDVDVVTVSWLDGGENLLSSVEITYDHPRPGGHLSWPTPAGTVFVNYSVGGTINGSPDPEIFAGFTECLP